MPSDKYLKIINNAYKIVKVIREMSKANPRLLNT